MVGHSSEPFVQVFGSIPMRSLTAGEIRWVQWSAPKRGRAGTESAPTRRQRPGTGGRNSSGSCPLVQQTLHPIQDGNGSNVTSLPAQIHDCPMPFALLEMANRQAGEFVATEPASKKYGKQCPISFPFDPLAVRRLPERLTLVGAQPVAEPHAELLDTFDSPDSRCQVGAE